VIGSAVVYAGLVAAFVGLIAVLRPIAMLGLATRGRGGALLLVGVGLVAIGLAVPVREKRVERPTTHLDSLVPVHQFDELHSTHVAALPDQVYRAIRDVTPREILFFQTLTRIRRLGRSGPESMLNAPDDKPIFDVATRSGVIVLADDRPREIVIGTVLLAPAGWKRSPTMTPDEFKSLTSPGYAVAALNFLIAPDGSGGTRLSTETRVFAADTRSRRVFARYWRLIYPGSALIRRAWLRAIRKRAEGA